MTTPPSGEIHYNPDLAGAVWLPELTAPRVVYRYRVPITDRPVLRMPRFATILSVGPSRDGRDELDLWAAVDPDQDDVDYLLAVVGTGHPLPTAPLAYIGTAPHRGGALIFHVFRLVTQP